MTIFAVKQTELARYVELLPLAAEKEELRRSILPQLEHGMLVEPGELEAVIEVRYQQRFTPAALSKLMSEEWVNEVRSLLPPTPLRYLTVGPSMYLPRDKSLLK